MARGYLTRGRAIPLSRPITPQRRGSRGGRVESLQFRNGATLKFMSGGGGDKSRAGFTSRVVVITETDGMDQPGAASREADKIKQLEARTRAFGNRKRIYMECTVSTQEGRTWQEYTHGTYSRIVLRCPHCRDWVSPEREHLTGWQGAENLPAARSTGAFACPACGETWSHEQRIVANQNAKLVHDGQTIDTDGVVQGTIPQSDTFGFRWSAVNNLFLTAGDIAGDEWRASRATDEENAERELRQFVWCLPVVPNKWDETSLESHELSTRVVPLASGVLPDSTTIVTAAMDLGKYLCHWIVVAWSPQAEGHVVDYGRIEVPSADLGVEQGILVALRQFKDLMLNGWATHSVSGDERVLPQQVWIDAGYMPDVVYSFCREAGERFRPAIGRGAAQQRHQWYNRPTSTGSSVRHIGEGFHMNWVPTERLYLVEIDADHWKTWVHQRLTTSSPALEFLANRAGVRLLQVVPSVHGFGLAQSKL